jgi:hypothetical protein
LKRLGIRRAPNEAEINSVYNTRARSKPLLSVKYDRGAVAIDMPNFGSGDIRCPGPSSAQ